MKRKSTGRAAFFNQRIVFAFALGLVGVFLAMLSFRGMAQSNQGPARTPAHGAGQEVQHPVQAFLEEPLRDKNGRVIEEVAAPSKNAIQSHEHPLSARARAEKALTDSHKAPLIKKAAPVFLGRVLLSRHRNGLFQAAGNPKSRLNGNLHIP
jgi:hypothetical protein